MQRCTLWAPSCSQLRLVMSHVSRLCRRCVPLWHVCMHHDHATPVLTIPAPGHDGAGCCAWFLVHCCCAAASAGGKWGRQHGQVPQCAWHLQQWLRAGTGGRARGSSVQRCRVNLAAGPLCVGGCVRHATRVWEKRGAALPCPVPQRWCVSLLSPVLSPAPPRVRASDAACGTHTAMGACHTGCRGAPLQQSCFSCARGCSCRRTAWCGAFMQRPPHVMPPPGPCAVVLCVCHPHPT